MPRGSERVPWPNDCKFAFTVFDDPDAQTLEVSRIVYTFLADLGLRTTIAVWPLGPRRELNSGGETCANPAYLELLLELKSKGFEIAFHNAFPHSALRAETTEALETFAKYFDGDPAAM